MPCDVLIVGGGLAGAAAATVLASAGWRPILLERDTAPKHKVCGEFLSEEALLMLQCLGVDPVQHGAVAIHAVRLATAERSSRCRLPFAARSLTRRCLDACMLAQAGDLGARVYRGAAVQHLERDRDAWIATLAGGEAFRAPAVILATGKHDLRGFGRGTGVQGELVALKMYLRLAKEQQAELAHTVELLLHPEGYTGLQMVEGDVANLSALVHRRRFAALGGWAGLWQELQGCNRHAARRLAGAECLLPKPLAISPVPYGLVRRTAVAEQMYAVGDQAAVIPSFTGDGMSLALYTGILAAQAVLTGTPAAVYQREMHASLRAQVWRATLLSRGLVSGRAKHLLVAFASAQPWTLRAAAAATRLPSACLAQALTAAPRAVAAHEHTPATESC